jgi:RNA polymerase sigma factor (TIGR02999 family)
MGRKLHNNPTGMDKRTAINFDGSTPVRTEPSPKPLDIADTLDMTQLLSMWSRGSREAEGDLFERSLPNLKRLARHMMKGERHQCLEPTELVNEVYLRMTAAKNRDWQGQGHFFAAAALAMRRHLIDCARKRHGVEFVEFFEDHTDCSQSNNLKLDLTITVAHLLSELARMKPDSCKLVELRYFTGLTEEETAKTMGISLRKTQRMWSNTRQWLSRQMERRGTPAVPLRCPRNRRNEIGTATTHSGSCRSYRPARTVSSAPILTGISG